FFAFALGIGQIFFIVNFFRSLFVGARAEANPWQVGTLEWTVPSPPAHHNFDVIPEVVRGPHEYANPDVRKALGRGWIGQTQPLPTAGVGGEEAAHGHS